MCCQADSIWSPSTKKTAKTFPLSQLNQLGLVPDLGHPTICPKSPCYHRALRGGATSHGGFQKRDSKRAHVKGLSIKLFVLSVHCLFIFQWMSVEYTKNMGNKCRPLSLKRICQSIDVFWKERGNRKAWKNNVSYLDTIYI